LRKSEDESKTRGDKEGFFERGKKEE